MLSLLARPFRRAVATVSPEVIEYGKNPACQEAIAKTNAIVFDTLTPPKLNPALVEEMRVYKEAELPYQQKLCEFRQRCWAARSLGFVEVTFSEAVMLLTGKEAADPKPGRFKFSNWTSWVETGEISEFSEANSKPGVHWSVGDQPSYQVGKTKERVMFGPPQELRVPIPMGAALRMIKMRGFKSGVSKYPNEDNSILKSVEKPLFDEFTILAPEWCWANPQPKDPILFGMVGGPYNRATKQFDHRLYMLARWE